ncbi:MAG: putative restriction endonuclease [Verrucomicrobia bacterium]|nr:MAG: putative restriction endonuclease [Verrucomicrobiota bacterium]
MFLASAIERLYDLQVGTTPVGEGKPHERPHKPLLLLAALDLIDDGKASAQRIPWCQDLRDRFTAHFLQVRKHNDQNTPENPFHYLQTQGFWQAWIESGTSSLPLQAPPLVNQMGTVFARFTEGFEVLVAMPAQRQRMREALIARYFPHLSSVQPLPFPVESPVVAEDEVDYGRSPAFRRLILDLYDHQCAACGLRIRLPSARDVSFIDAAHLIPFAESRNDHPTNGLALCKNHHWAMDRDIIAPGPDLHWHVSKLLDPRRSNGEKELAELAGKSVLLPKDPAFHPEEKGLRWRREKLIA